MGYIYKITNKINNKVYIGQTSRKNVNERYLEHIRESRKDKNKNRPLYNAFRKYGIDNFKMEVLEEIDNELLSEKEKYYINLYNSFEDGYNATIGGDGKRNIKYTEKEIIEFYLQEGSNIVTHTAKHFGISNKVVRRILDSNHVYHMTVNDYLIYQENNLGTKVKQIDKNTGQVIHIFNTVSEANIFLGKPKNSTNIQDCLHNRNNRKTAYGYKWCYA